jgi:hypothetical protein
MRPHFVRARVKVHVYPGGSHAVFHGPRCIGRYDEKGRIKDAVPIQRAAELRSAARLWKWDNAVALPQSHRETKREEADKPRTTKTGQLHSLST